MRLWFGEGLTSPNRGDLPAGTAMLGAWPITLDPIFSGLTWSLIFGLFASTRFTLFVIPVCSWLLYANKPGHGVPMNELLASEHPAPLRPAELVAKT